MEKNLLNADYNMEQFASDLCMSRTSMYRKDVYGMKSSDYFTTAKWYLRTGYW